jgi:NAD(P)H-quinone oxidoreductase subunit 6
MDNMVATLAPHAEGNVESICFMLLAIIAIPLAYGVIFDRNIIRSGFTLIGVFSAISGMFLLLQAQFLAMAQIMIYAVGITLVVVIALMLTNPRMELEASPMIEDNKLAAVFVACLVFITTFLAVDSGRWRFAPTLADPNFNTFEIGKYLTTTFSFPFEFASILLLAALIGAVTLAKSESPTEGFDIQAINNEAAKASDKLGDREDHAVKI